MPHVGEHAPQPGRVGDGALGEPLDRPAEDLLLQLRGRVGEQHQPDAGGGQGEPPADAGEHRNRPGPGDPLDEHDLGALPDRELDVLLGHLGQVLQERQGALAQPGPARRQRAELEQPQPHPVAAGLVAFQRSPGDQLADQPVGGGQRQAGVAGDLAQRHRRAGRRRTRPAAAALGRGRIRSRRVRVPASPSPPSFRIEPVEVIFLAREDRSAPPRKVRGSRQPACVQHLLDERWVRPRLKVVSQWLYCDQVCGNKIGFFLRF